MATATEIAMVDIVVADLARMIPGRDLTKAMGTRRIPENCEDIRCSEASFGLSCGGFFEHSVFLPFITRGKRFLDAIFHQGSIAIASHG